MDAQQPVTIEFKSTGVERFGVYVHRHGSPKFDFELQRMLGSAVPRTLDQVFAFCIVVENRSAGILRGFVVRYGHISRDGQAGAYTVRLVNTSSDATHGFRQGEVQLVCIDGAVERAVSERTLVTMSADSFMNTQQFRAKRSVEISLDSIVFPDGRVAGLDVSNTVGYLNAMSAATRDLIESAIQLRNQPGTLRSMLTAKSEVRARPDDVYPSVQRKHARMMLLQLERVGTAAFASHLDRLRASLSDISFRRADQ